MGARIGYGAAWGALPLAGVIAAAAAGNVNLATALTVLVVFAALVVPLAPFLPVLHRLPLVGSPQMEVVFRLNGRRDLTLTTPKGDEHTCVLEVEVSNPSRWFAVKGAWINFLIPSGIKVGRCDQYGNPDDEGQWEEFHAHQLGDHSRADYWYDTDIDLPPRLTRRIRIKLFLGIGEESTLEYPILFKLSAPSLYSPIEEGATIVVQEGESDLATQMGKAITSGERTLAEVTPPVLLGEPHEKERRVAAMAFAAEAAELLNPAIEDNPLPQTPADADADSHHESVEMHLRALYVVRNEFGRAAD